MCGEGGRQPGQGMHAHSAQTCPQRTAGAAEWEHGRQTTRPCTPWRRTAAAPGLTVFKEHGELRGAARAAGHPQDHRCILGVNTGLEVKEEPACHRREGKGMFFAQAVELAAQFRRWRRCLLGAGVLQLWRPLAHI